MIDTDGDVTFAQSDIGTYLWCRRNFAWTVARRLEVDWPADSEGITKPGSWATGQLVHKGVELIRAGEEDMAVIDEAIDVRGFELSKMTEHADYSSNPEWVTHKRYAKTMVRGWERHLARTGEEVGIDTLVQEDRLWVPFGTYSGRKVTLTGKPDAIQRDRNHNDAIVVNDVKTTTSITDTQEYNRQLMTYAIMLRMLGHDVRFISTTQLIRQLKATEKTPRLFGRTEMLISEEQWDRAWDELDQVISEMTSLAIEVAEDDNMRRALQNPGRDCDWRCSVKDLCDTHNRGGNVEHLIQFNYRVKENPFDY